MPRVGEKGAAHERYKKSTVIILIFYPGFRWWPGHSFAIPFKNLPVDSGCLKLQVILVVLVPLSLECKVLLQLRNDGLKTRVLTQVVKRGVFHQAC